MSTVAINPGFARSRTRRPARTTPVRLTRRGRLVAVLLFLVLLTVVLTVFGSRSAATGEVGEGDTLWVIASEVAEPGQVRDMVHRIQELNALSGASLQVGQEIAVPLH